MKICVWLYGYGRGGAVLSALILSSSDKARDHCWIDILSVMCCAEGRCEGGFIFSFINIQTYVTDVIPKVATRYFYFVYKLDNFPLKNG